jgi:4-diphosphocytidyl-2-C-methyl-D-erythritol kinase
MPLRLPSPCKVNFLLNILGKRPDGYHELETLLHPVPLHDFLTLEHSGPGVELSCSEPVLPVDGRNLVYRAAKTFFHAWPSQKGVRIHLEKRVPLAAGLGGGSANAAVTLLGLNQLFGHPLAPERLRLMAADLGSDVPFFLQNNPALATGRGEIIASLAPFASLQGFHILLVHPGFGISTPWAYQQLARFPEALHGTPGRAARLVKLLRTDPALAAKDFYNSLEPPALRKYPLLGLFQKFFLEAGAVGALMSGSGSSTFALAPDAKSAASILARFRARFGERIFACSIPLERSDE